MYGGWCPVVQGVLTWCGVMGVVHRMMGPECPEVSAHVFDLLNRPPGMFSFTEDHPRFKVHVLRRFCVQCGAA